MSPFREEQDEDQPRQRGRKRRRPRHVSETENLGVNEETYEALMKDYEEYGGEG